MKKINLVLLVASLLIFSKNSNAQKDSSGIYKTADDFKSRKLSYAINYKTEEHKIKSYLFFKDNTIKVKHKGTTYSLNKNETYGYRNTMGVEYRFVDNKEYTILNPGEPVLIFSYQNLSKPPKGAVEYPVMYFFTTDAAAIPQPLTKANLKAGFPDNHKFHDALDENFKTDDGLAAYDNFHKMYKVNHILDMSLK